MRKINDRKEFIEFFADAAENVTIESSFGIKQDDDSMFYGDPFDVYVNRERDYMSVNDGDVWCACYDFIEANIERKYAYPLYIVDTDGKSFYWL